jgi:hypothetical protein
MAHDDGKEGGKFRDIFSIQLRHFDRQLLEVREFHESLGPEERAEMRDWLEKVIKLERECKLTMHLRVHVDNDCFDDDGNQTHGGAANFSASTILAAIASWEKGEPFTPTSIMP